MALNRICLALFTLAVAWTNLALAEPRIELNRGTTTPMPIAVTDLVGSTVGADITRVVAADLERSGLFAPIDQKAFIQSADSIGVQPRFADWKLINAQALVSGSATQQPDGRLRVEFRLWDVYGEAQMEGQMLAADAKAWRRIAHKIADAVYKRITGEAGYFDTEIVYVSESGPATRRIKRLAIMDQDGANARVLTDGRALVITPRFSPTSRDITYMSYFNNQPRVYLFNLDSGKQEVVGDFPNMSFAPRFSPDGNRVVMSMDRGGSQQVYVMNADGSGQTRISFGSGSYATPVWSPRGDRIAFTKLEKGQFLIGTMDTEGKAERIVANSYLDEGPTWAPNGRVLMFFRQTQGGVARLMSVDVTGANLREVATPTDASDPAWSPLIP